MKVIVPCCGKSSRYPNMRPKYMLTHPDGNLILFKSIQNLGVTPKDIIVTILKEHDIKYDIAKGIKENIGEEVTVIVLDKPTKSQPETIYRTLELTKLKESFLIKDSDNTYAIEKINEEHNYVCYSDLQEYDEINARNKSYIDLNEQNIITQMVEKKIISKFFSVGGYYFSNPDDFIKTYKKLIELNLTQELYTSHIIQDMILNQKKIFLGKKVSNYIDWGTFEDWYKYRKNFRTYFADIDGIVFKSAAQYTRPRWSEAEPIEKNVETLKKISENPNTQLFFMTSRPEKYREFTEKRLKELGLKHDGLIMGCLHANRVIINDFANTTRYPTCEAINILRDSEDLGKYI